MFRAIYDRRGLLLCFSLLCSSAAERGAKLRKGRRPTNVASTSERRARVAASVAASVDVWADVWADVEDGTILCDSPLSQRRSDEGEGSDGFTRLVDGWGEVDGPVGMVLCHGGR